MSERNANLDLIKCIACIAVVGLHAVGMNNYTIYYFCDFGVPLFFMVNGYLLLSHDEAGYSYAFRKIFLIIKNIGCVHFNINSKPQCCKNDNTNIFYNTAVLYAMK